MSSWTRPWVWWSSVWWSSVVGSVAVIAPAYLQIASLADQHPEHVRVVLEGRVARPVASGVDVEVGDRVGALGDRGEDRGARGREEFAVDRPADYREIGASRDLGCRRRGDRVDAVAHLDLAAARRDWGRYDPLGVEIV